MASPDFESMTPEQLAEYQRQNCIFCKIVKDEIPSKKVFEDDKVVAILDINPAAKGHTLVLPKEHHAFLPVIPAPLQEHLFKVAKRMAFAVRHSLAAQDVTVFIANGAVAGQQSPHFLLHVIPRHKDDDLGNFVVPAHALDQAEKDKLAQSLRSRVAPQSPVQDDRLKNLARMIHENPGLKELIEKDPEGFKDEIKKYPELVSLFAGIDISKLAAAFKGGSNG